MNNKIIASLLFFNIKNNNNEIKNNKIIIFSHFKFGELYNNLSYYKIF